MENIKRARAGVVDEKIAAYLDNLEVSSAHVACRNIINHDETNFTDPVK